MDDDALRARHAAAQRALYAAVTPATAGGRVLELAGGAVQAAVAPAVPDVSLFNAAVYCDGAALLGARDELAATYAAAGVRAWTVWVRPGDDAVAAGLRAAGHAHDGRPLLMGADLGAIDLDPRGDVVLDLDPSPSFAVLADLNDAAYGAPAGTFAPAVAGLDAVGPQAWVARAGGRPVAALCVALHAGDAYVWLVATRPEARGRGLARELLRTALRAVRDGAGATTTTLEATAMGEGVYRRLGYRELGRLGMWEQRPPA
jgi:ribosomal protein S18 acetylase RimI-like enzyme